MAVQRITHKSITRFNERDGNFKKQGKPKEKVVDGNIIEEDIYGEKKHTYQPDNGNLQMNEMMSGIMNKLDGLTMHSDEIKQNRAVEVDIKRSIAIGKADMSDIKSEEFKGKVMNKKDKLKALRRKNGR